MQDLDRYPRGIAYDATLDGTTPLQVGDLNQAIQVIAVIAQNIHATAERTLTFRSSDGSSKTYFAVTLPPMENFATASVTPTILPGFAVNGLGERSGVTNRGLELIGEIDGSLEVTVFWKTTKFE